MDTVKQSPINNAFVSDCLAPRMGLLKNRGHMFSSSGQWSLYATHPHTHPHPVFSSLNCETAGLPMQLQLSNRCRTDFFRHFRVTVLYACQILMGILVKPHIQINSDRECVICVRVSLWRMAAEVTSLKSIHWWGPACDPGPLRHINHNPFLLAFIRPAESYCPASATTPPSLITSLL